MADEPKIDTKVEGQLKQSEESLKRARQIGAVVARGARTGETPEEFLSRSSQAQARAVSQVTQAASNVIESQQGLIRNMAKVAGNISIAVAKEVKQTMSEVGRAISEDISIQKKNVLALSFARATPVVGYFISKFFETDVFKRLKEKLKVSMTSLLSSIGSKAASVASKIPIIGKAFKGKGKFESEITEVPKLQKGGLVTKKGIVEVHAGEVVTPVNKLYENIEERMQRMEMRSTEERKETTMLSLKRMDSLIGQILPVQRQAAMGMMTLRDPKQRRGLWESFLFHYKRAAIPFFKTFQERVLEGMVRMQRALARTPNIMTEALTRTIIEHPTFRLFGFIAKTTVKSITSPLRLLFGARGTYARMIPRRGAPLEQISQILAQTFIRGMFKMDFMISYLRQIGQRLAPQVSFFTGRDPGEMQPPSRRGWKFSKLLLRGVAAPIEAAVKTILPKIGAAGLAEWSTRQREVKSELLKVGKFLGTAFPKTMIRGMKEILAIPLYAMLPSEYHQFLDDLFYKSITEYPGEMAKSFKDFFGKKVKPKVPTIKLTGGGRVKAFSDMITDAFVESLIKARGELPKEEEPLKIVTALEQLEKSMKEVKKEPKEQVESAKQIFKDTRVKKELSSVISDSTKEGVGDVFDEGRVSLRKNIRKIATSTGDISDEAKNIKRKMRGKFTRFLTTLTLVGGTILSNIMNALSLGVNVLRSVSGLVTSIVGGAFFGKILRRFTPFFTGLFTKLFSKGYGMIKGLLTKLLPGLARTAPKLAAMFGLKRFLPKLPGITTKMAPKVPGILGKGAGLVGRAGLLGTVGVLLEPLIAMGGVVKGAIEAKEQLGKIMPEEEIGLGTKLRYGTLKGLKWATFGLVDLETKLKKELNVAGEANKKAEKAKAEAAEKFYKRLSSEAKKVYGEQVRKEGPGAIVTLRHAGKLVKHGDTFFLSHEPAVRKLAGKVMGAVPEPAKEAVATVKETLGPPAKFAIAIASLEAAKKKAELEYLVVEQKKSAEELGKRFIESSKEHASVVNSAVQNFSNNIQNVVTQGGSQASSEISKYVKDLTKGEID